MKIDWDKEKVDEVLTRGVANVYPTADFLRDRLTSGERLSVYLGIDPTAPTLHLGSAIPLMKLRQFQRMGHRVILLIGDFTATIGDPDKMSVRKPLSREEVMGNAKHYKEQVSIFLDFGGDNPAELKYNSEWLSKLSFADILDITSNVTYAQLVHRDMFQKRIAEGRDLYLHEFMYPVMQGYDSVAMDIDGEIGGSDQTFNMLVGRDLMKKMKGKEKFVLTLKLLEDPSGAKMGKTEGNMVAFTDAPNEMFGKVMSWTDGMIIPGLELCTYVSDKEIKNIGQELAAGANPRDKKMFLAEKIIEIYHGKDAAQSAKEWFVKTFREKEIPDDIETVSVKRGTKLADVFVQFGLAKSKSDFRRLAEGGGITAIEEGEINDPHYEVGTDITLKIGKRRFLKVRAEE
jgi:tyrosyl-tRNA synthetase